MKQPLTPAPGKWIPVVLLAGLVAACTPPSAPSERPATAPQPAGPRPTGLWQGVVTHRLLEPTHNGATVRWRFAVYSSQGTTPRSLLLRGTQEPTLQGPNGPVPIEVGDELLVRLDRPKSPNDHPRPVLLKVLGRGRDTSDRVPTFTARPPDDAAAAEDYWRLRLGQRCIVPAGALVQGGHRTLRHGGVSDIVLLRADHPVATRSTPYHGRLFRDPHPLDDNAALLHDNGNAARITLGDLGLKAAARDASLLLPPVTTFSRLVQPVTGVVTRLQGRYSVQVDTAPAFTSGLSPDRNRLPLPTGATDLSAATFNLENLYDHRDDPYDPQDDPPAPGTSEVKRDYVPRSEQAYRHRLKGLALQVVKDLESPALILVQEAEDQDICVLKDGGLVSSPLDDADGELDVLQELALAIRAQGGPLYRSLCARSSADVRGIVNAYLYRPDLLAPARPDPQDPLLGKTLAIDYEGEILAHGSGVNPRAINAVHPEISKVLARPPQVATFLPINTRRPLIYAINNHFSSRPDERVQRRTEQARFNAALARTLLKAKPNAMLILGGDLNVYPRPDDPFSDPPSDQLGSLYDAGLINLHQRLLKLLPEAAYTYVFQGQAQTLDHLFVSPALDRCITHVRAEHINADYGYRPELPHRGVSDHDPVVVTFTFGR